MKQVSGEKKSTDANRVECIAHSRVERAVRTMSWAEVRPGSVSTASLSAQYLACPTTDMIAVLKDVKCKKKKRKKK